MAKQVEAVIACRESSSLRRTCEGSVDRSLDSAIEFEVDDHSADRADQVVVMMGGQPLGKLVAGKVIVGDDAGDRASFFEHGEIAVDARLTQACVRSGDLVDREWSGALLQRSDKAASAGGVPLLDGAKKCRDFFVDASFTHPTETSGPARRRCGVWVRIG